MAAATIKTDPIKSDSMKFRTQIIDGKPQIFFDADDDSQSKTRLKRNSRATRPTNRLEEQQKYKSNVQKPPIQNGMNKAKSKANQSNSKIRVNEDGSTLGVYMTMDEIADLVKAVKETSRNETTANTEVKTEPPQLPPHMTAMPPPPPPPQQQQQHQRTEVFTQPIVPKLDLPIEPPPAPPTHVSPHEQGLSIMAERKKQKWLRERAEIERLQLEIEYDQLKHQLSPRHKVNSVSPERSTYQYDFPQATGKPPPVPLPQQPSKPIDYNYIVSPKVTENPNQNGLKTQLMERKQQQWKQENMENVLWNPFGRPGGGAPNIENQSKPIQNPSNTIVSYRPPIPPQQQQQQQQQQHQQFTDGSSPTRHLHSDQTQIPAAMRRNLFFGNVLFEEDVKTAKEIERRQWLDDLQRQVEEKKQREFVNYESLQRQDFLHENVQPIMQEAANRHQHQMNHTGQDAYRYNQRESSVQQTHDRSYETTDRRAQLIDKLKRSGYQTDLLGLDGKSNSSASANQRTGEKLFGPNYDSSSGQYTNNRLDTSHLNIGFDQQRTYRPMDARKDEAVNTVDSTFRSDHGVQTDFRPTVHRQINPSSYEDSDLPPQVPNHHYRNSGYRNVQNQPGKKNPRTNQFDENSSVQRTSSVHQNNPNHDGSVSRMSGQRPSQGPFDIQARPLWNYNNPDHREYVPNSKRDPHYEKRQRLKHFAQGNFDRIDDVQKQLSYNRWNSDSELQQQKKKSSPMNRIHSTTSKISSQAAHKDESILNLLKVQNKFQRESLGARKASSLQRKNDDDFNSHRGSSLDRFENYPTQTDDMYERTKIITPFSRSRDTSPHKELIDNNINDNCQQRDWDNAYRQNQRIEQPQSRQEHILQQLSAIKETLIRRQRELAT